MTDKKPRPLAKLLAGYAVALLEGAGEAAQVMIQKERTRAREMATRARFWRGKYERQCAETAKVAESRKSYLRVAMRKGKENMQLRLECALYKQALQEIAARGSLPDDWDGHPTAIALYNAAVKLAWKTWQGKMEIGLDGLLVERKDKDDV